ncbi:MAG: SDR family NAD(P)-dependent oxidoreductase [Gemmatimonadota bacterium]
MILRDKTALITGASGGIGRATASALAAAGSRLVLTALEPKDLDRITRELTDCGAKVTSFAANLLDEEDRKALLDWTRNQAPLDILVNNAGIGHFAPFSASKWEDIERVFTLVASVPTRLIHALLPVLLTRPEAAIVNVSSGTYRIPYSGLAVYAASKAYLSSLSQTLATELDDTAVRVLCLHPGFTATGFFTTAGMDTRRIPGWAISSPERVAKRIVRMLEKNDPWAYSDFATPIELVLATAIPHRLRPRVFRELFWDFPATL